MTHCAHADYDCDDILSGYIGPLDIVSCADDLGHGARFVIRDRRAILQF